MSDEAGMHAQAPAHATAVRVYFQDTDAGGIVYHGRYLDFFERCRMDWLRALEFPIRVLERDHGVVFIVHELRVTYLRPARLEDELSVELELAGLKGARLELRQRVVRGPDTLVSADVLLACVDCAGLRPARIPLSLRERLAGPGRRLSGMFNITSTTP